MLTNNLEKNMNAYEFSVYPNPNNGNFKLILTKSKEVPSKILVEDMLGRTIMSINNINSYSYDFNLGAIANGMFIVKVNYPDRTLTKKVVRN